MDSKGKKMFVTDRKAKDNALVLALTNDSDSRILDFSVSFHARGDASRLSNYEKG